MDWSSFFQMDAAALRSDTCFWENWAPTVATFCSPKQRSLQVDLAHRAQNPVFRNNRQDHSWLLCRLETIKDPEIPNVFSSYRRWQQCPPLLTCCTALWQTLAALHAFFLDPVHVEGFVLECSGKQRDVLLCIWLDGFTKPRVGGRDEVWLVVSFPVHDLMTQRASMLSPTATVWPLSTMHHLKWNVPIKETHVRCIFFMADSLGCYFMLAPAGTDTNSAALQFFPIKMQN